MLAPRRHHPAPPPSQSLTLQRARPPQRTKQGKAQAHKRRVAQLTKKAIQAEATTKVVRETMAKVTRKFVSSPSVLLVSPSRTAWCIPRPQIAAKLAKLQSRLQKAATYNGRVVDETEKLSRLEVSAEHRDDLSRLRELISLNESLKSQESAFKANCARQLAELDAILSELKAKGGSDEEDARLSEIERMHESVRGLHRTPNKTLA